MLRFNLINATRLGDVDTVRELLQEVDDINFLDHSGRGLLHYATKYGNCAMVTLLLDQGARISIRTLNRLTPLHYATKMGLNDVAECLLRYEPNVNALDFRNCTPLHYAKGITSRSVLRTLISRARDVEQRCIKGTRPIERAVDGCNEYMVDLLVDRGANVHVKNERTGYSLLWHSCFIMNASIIMNSLLRGGADPGVLEPNGLTVFNLLLEMAPPKLVELMFDHGASLDTKTFRKYTVLHSAVLNRNLSVVQRLVDRGADITACTINGTSVLKMAFSSQYVPQYYDIVEYLIWKGAKLESDILDWNVMCRPFENFEKKEFIIMKYMALKEHMKLLPACDKSSIHANIDLLKFSMECEEEIKRLQAIKVNYGYSLLDVLLTNEQDEILDYVEACNIADAFDSCKFPIYSSTFSLIFTGDLHDKLSVRNAREYIRRTLDLNSTTHLVIEKILSYFSVKELTKFNPKFKAKFW